MNNKIEYELILHSMKIKVKKSLRNVSLYLSTPHTVSYGCSSLQKLYVHVQMVKETKGDKKIKLESPLSCGL